MAEDKTKVALAEEKDDVSAIDNSALSKQPVSDDEASLNDALSRNPIKMGLIRLTIKLKNHLSIIPLLLAILTMIVITFTIPWHVQSLLRLKNDTSNALLFFLNILDSLLIVMTYMRVSSRKSTLKQKIIMSVLFYLLIGASLFLDYYYLYDIQLEMSLYNSLNKVTDSEDFVIAASKGYTNLHLVFLYITIGSSILAPALQPLTKKIRIRIK
jgi:hypothetical protein